MTKISVVIPVYGVEKYIDQLFKSIRQQKLEDIEVIFVDDGSPDRCPELLDAFVETDSRYKVIHQANGGVSAARNTGLAHATGEYVYIIDSDDWLADDALENLWTAAEETGADIIYGDWYQDIDGEVIKRSLCEKAFCTEDRATIDALQCAIHNKGIRASVSRPEFETLTMGGAPWRAMIRRALIEENNLRYDPYVKGLGDDILFSLHLYEYVRKVAYIQKPIYYYRIVQLSYSHGYKATLLQTYSCIFERMEAFLRDNRKEEPHWTAYYQGVLFYVRQSMVRYFKNAQNPNAEAVRFAEMKALFKTKPYKTAFAKVPVLAVAGKRRKVELLLLKLKLFRLYWMFQK